MTTVHEHLEPLAKIGQAAKKAAADCSFKMLHFALAPVMEGDGPVHAQLIFQYDPDEEGKPDVIEIQVSQAMNDQLDETRREELKKKADDARKELGDLFKDGRRGFLD